MSQWESIHIVGSDRGWSQMGTLAGLQMGVRIQTFLRAIHQRLMLVNSIYHFFATAKIGSQS